MKKIMQGICISTIVGTVAMAGVYIVPKDYDNYVMSVKSKNYGIITNSTKNFSGNTYEIGGKNVRYRCLVIPKIKCGGGKKPQMYANVSESSLRDSHEALMQTWQLDLRLEDDTAKNNWYVCGAGYGGQFWDDSKLTSSTDKDGNVQLNYSYKPNAVISELYYFTSVANSSKQSYMSISYEQICK